MRKRYVKKTLKRALSIFVMLTMLVSSILISGVKVDAASDISVNWNDEKQVIDGFGVSQAGWSSAIYNMQEPARSEIMDLLFTQNGIGLSILRGEIFPDYSPAAGVYDFATPRQDQVWVMQQAKARGIDKLVATTWSPPAWMKKNNQTTNGGYLKDDCYDDYALYMAKFVKEYKRLFDIDFYAVSMSNEPNSMTFLSWNSCEWNSTGIKNFLGNYLKPTFQSEGITNTKVIAAEPSWWDEAMMKDALNDANANSRLDIVGAHSYPVPVINVPKAIVPFSTAISKGKKVWMTEVSKTNSYDPSMTSGLTWAKNIYDFMTKANVNAWLYWTGAISSQCDEGLICTNLQNSTYNTTKRLYTMGQYSKFVKPGYIRIGSTANPVSGVYTSSYKDPLTGKFSVVVINDNSYTCDINIVPSGFTAGKVTPYTTNDSLDIAQGNDIPLVNGKFNALIPPKSVTTYIGVNGSSPMPAIQSVQDNLNDWTATYSHTSGLKFDGSNSSYFENDTSRVTRINSTTDEIVYNINSLKNFTAYFYQYKTWDGIAFYVSPDNINWTSLDHVSTDGVSTGGSWTKKIYVPLKKIPDGTNYLKVQISGTGTWEKQLAKIELKY